MGRKLIIRGEGIPQWKIDKIRNYYNGGWLPDKIAIKLEVKTYEVVGILFEDPVQTTVMGHKDEPYYTDEMDYLKLARPEPLPIYRHLFD